MLASKRFLSTALPRLLAVMAIGLCSESVSNLSAQEITVEEAITYSTVGDVELQLDIAYPKDGKGPFPTIVCIHGGAWAGGSRKDFRSIIEKAAKRGYLGASVSYRLMQIDPTTKAAKYPFPVQIQDCKCAVRYLRSVADKYHIDKDRIGVMGGSAGGHLALLVGMSPTEKSLDDESRGPKEPSSVKAVVNIFGPTELVAEYNDVPAVRDLLIGFCKGAPEAAADMYKFASPLTYVSKDAPPILTLHGDADPIVPVNQAKMLDEALKKVGAPHELKIFPGAPHGFPGEQGREADDAMWAFFEKHLKTAP